MKNLTNENVIDAIIVGAGPAGLTAAIYLGRAGYKPLVFEKEAPGGKMIKTGLIDNYPGFENIQGPELSMDMYNQAIKHGAEIEYDEVVHFKKLDNGLFEVHTVGGKKLFSKILIIATGTLENKLGIPGEDKLYGKGVSYCAVCDGPFYKGEDVAVVGGGYSAVTEGTYLANIAKTVYVIIRKDHFKADENQVKIFTDKPNVKVIYNTVVEEINGDNAVESIRIKNSETGKEETLDAKAIFPYIGAKPITQFVEYDDLKDKMEYLQVSANMETKVDGLYAAGDVRQTPLRQIATATGDGTIAGQMAVEKLQNWK